MNASGRQNRGGIILLGALLMAFGTAIAYLPAMRGGFVWDDDSMLSQNPIIQAPDGLRRLWFTSEAADFWPVTYTTLWVEWRLWGMHAVGYHITNVVLHIAEAMLIWAILRRLRVPGAYLAALLFSVHPVNVESVAWITQRKNLMAMLFYLLSIRFFIQAELADDGPAIGSRPRPTTAAYWLSLAAFALAMLSKGSVALLPVVLLGLIAWHRRLNGGDLRRTAPFFLVAALLAAVDIWFQRHGSSEAIRSAGAMERLAGAGSAVVFYLFKALLPVHLDAVYPQWSIRTDELRWWLPLLGVLGVTAVLWSRRTGPWRAAFFAWAYFCASLVPVMGFTNVYFMRYSLVADHYQHLAILGVVALAAAAWAVWLERSGGPWPRMAAAAVILILGTLTWRQCRNYSDLETYYTAILKGNPDCWMAHDNLGDVLRRTGRPREAISHYRQALQVRPDYTEAENNLGVALVDAGRVDEAILWLERAVHLKPGDASAQCNLGLAFVAAGRWTDAVPRFEAAVRIRPDYAEAEENLGIALARTGRASDGLVHEAAAVRIDPNLPEARYNLGTLLAQAGRLTEGIASLEEALRLKPDYIEAHLNLGRALSLAGRDREATEHLEAAARLKRGERPPGKP